MIDILGRLEKWIGWLRTVPQWQKVLISIFGMMVLAVFFSFIMFLVNWQIDSLISSVFTTVISLFVLAVLYLVAHFLGLFGKILDKLGVQKDG
jgi:membrane protein required for beta-lactamase induction